MLQNVQHITNKHRNLSLCIPVIRGGTWGGQQLTTSFEQKFFVCRHVSMWGFQNPVCLSVLREKKSPWLRQYQSYIGNWYINGKVFTSTTPWKPKIGFLHPKKKFEFEFWLVPKSLNHLSFVNMSLTLVIETLMEESSWVPTTALKPNNLNFLSKKFEIEF